MRHVADGGLATSQVGDSDLHHVLACPEWSSSRRYSQRLLLAVVSETPAYPLPMTRAEWGTAKDWTLGSQQCAVTDLSARRSAQWVDCVDGNPAHRPLSCPGISAGDAAFSLGFRDSGGAAGVGLRCPARWSTASPLGQACLSGAQIT